MGKLIVPNSQFWVDRYNEAKTGRERLLASLGYSLAMRIENKGGNGKIGGVILTDDMSRVIKGDMNGKSVEPTGE